MNMFCSNCGKQVGDNDKFCKTCGTPVQVRAAAPVIPQAPVYQQPVQAVPQVVPQTIPQPVPALANAKRGPRRACFVVGLITCILLILETFPVFCLGGTMFIIGPFAMMIGADNNGEFFAYALMLCLGGFALMDLAILSIVFNGICTKITAKRPASKCRSLRIAAAVLALIDSVLMLAPAIGLNNLMSDAEFLYAIFGVTLILAITFLILAISTNSKEKNLTSV